MHSPFPAGVRIKVGKTGAESEIVDLRTGLPVAPVKSIFLNLHAETRQPRIDLTVDAAVATITGEARWILDEETLERIACDNGYTIAKISDEQRS